MNDRNFIMVMVNGIGAHLTNDEKRAAFDRFEAGASDRSGMCFRTFCRRKNDYRFLHPYCTKSMHRYSSRKRNGHLSFTARLTEHVVAPVRRGIRAPMVYQATDPFYCGGT
jgi:hypothetical protein